MENKQQNFSRSVNSKTCQSSEANRKSSDLQLNKARRRDHSTAAKNEQTRHASKQTNNNNATKQKQQNRFNADKRPRPRGGGGGTGTGRYQDGAACESEDLASAGTGLATGGRYGQHGPSDYELNSVYAAGSKKHNLNHLLNFHYAPREADYAMHGLSFFGRHSGGGGTGSNGNSGNNKARIRQHKYNKEQFLQANFQFVIRAQAKPKFDASPDALIDWNLIEQINIQTTEEPQCPICLYPPIAAKITRCGHVYCWPCLLHYLSLADKSWRKCPICYEAIHAADLKSCTIMQQQTVNVSEPITFRLMRRRRGSLFIEPYVCASPSVERYPQFSKNDMMQRFSKFLIANRSDVHEILERERRELSLSAAIDEGGASGSEYVFIEQALSLLQERFEKLVPEQCEEIKEEQEEEQQLEKPEDSSVVDQVVTEHAAVAQSNLLTIDEHTESLMTDTESLDSGEHLSNASALTPTDSDSLTAASDIISPDITGGGGNSTKYHYFYQSEDGQNNYLHPLNIKMLQACYGSLDKAPLIITAKIVQREQFTMDDDHRRKLTCLSHLPLTCQLSFVEVDLQPPIVSSNILKIFKADIMYRRKERQRRQREECKREKHINELNDRQMGKLIASAANLNMNSPEEFPTCGFDDLPPLASSAGSSNGGTPAPRQNVFSYSTVTKVDDSWPATGPPRRNNAHFQELSSVGQMRRSTAGNKKLQPVSATPAPAVVESCDGVYSSMSTCLGDVLAEAFSQKHTTKGSQHKRDELQSSHNLQQQQQGSAGGAAGVTGGTPTSATTKKSKKSKKMIPIFATGMNYNGNN